jgi:polysaccharide deacetylase family protein (PEP-CTERM system associated)
MEPPPSREASSASTVVLSFDVEEHHRIEAAAGLRVDAHRQADYALRAGEATRRLLGLLASRDLKATFFIVGEFARRDPALVRAIADGGHEVASHGWDHCRVLEMNFEEFREDVRRARDALEQITGGPVVGYRAPTFSIVPRTAWAIDVLAEAGFAYDSSIFPVRHDRYGVSRAPRQPFVACGPSREILELPPATLRLGPWNLPVAGGGYFRLFPPWLLRAGLRQAARVGESAVATLYFHPWEFDPDQPQLPLRRLSRFRTYVGIRRNLPRLERLLEHALARYTFRRAADLAGRTETRNLPRFHLAGATRGPVSPLGSRHLGCRKLVFD